MLNGGLIQQLGAPQELYDHPANLFVAGFIGSPAMNFFPGARVLAEGETTKIVVDSVGQVEVPALSAQAARGVAGKQLTLGIRPEHLEDVALLPPGSQNGSAINAPVEVVEHLGSELLVYARAGGHSMTARIDPRSDAHTGGTMRFKVDNERMHLFETETGQAIF